MKTSREQRGIEMPHPRLALMLGRLAARFPALDRRLRRSAMVQENLNREFEAALPDLERSLKPYNSLFASNERLPTHGRGQREILNDLKMFNRFEQEKWRKGYASGAVYHGDERHIRFLNQVCALASQSNPLHADLWPATTRMENEIVSMTAHMLGAPDHEDDPEKRIFGNVSSGGTESILLAVKTYRDRARELHGVRHPEMIVPVTAHAAFDKAAEYFHVRKRTIPTDGQFRADVRAARRLINRRTILMVASAPSFPHGTIDPIAELSELARRSRIGFHVDACLGGFILPWAERLGYPVPPFDFRLPGVTSISADTHKYGYAAKGTSVILYRGESLRQFQYFTATEWPGGLYFSPTFAGSRPGALSAACWASLLSLGEKGYLAAAKKILQTAERIKKGIQEIRELKILGDPLWVIAFASESLDIYRIMEALGRKGWSLNGLHHPPAVHFCITLRHCERGVARRFLRDLRSAVVQVRENPGKSEGMAPIYGLAATLPLRGVVIELLRKYMDFLYRP